MAEPHHWTVLIGAESRAEVEVERDVVVLSLGASEMTPTEACQLGMALVDAARVAGMAKAKAAVRCPP